jgi:hypothetical protein
MKKEDKEPPAVVSATPALDVANPGIVKQPITDPLILNEGSVLKEALYQTATPLAVPGTPEAGQAAQTIAGGSSLPNGLRPDTCKGMATEPSGLSRVTGGRYPESAAAEIVVVHDYKELHAGKHPGIVNPPERIADNVADIRLSPDPTSRKDLVFRFRTKDGMLITKYNGQVKTGSSQYIADSLTEMAEKPGYGKVGYIDSRFVNGDGTPRVAPDAFTEAQARHLQKTGVRLRGIPNLEDRAEKLIDNVKRHSADGLDPVARQELQQFRDDIARAYEPKGITTRVLSGVAVAAATAALVSLVIQFASNGEIDVAALGEASGKAALFGAGGAALDAGIYHVATQMGYAPEAAQTIAQNGVASGFCLLAIGADLWSEIQAARNGEISVANAVAGSAGKVSLDLLPFVLAPLGWIGVPILIGAQLGGRWAIAKWRESNEQLYWAIQEDFGMVLEMDHIIEDMDFRITALVEASDENDRIFAKIMGHQPQLRIA